MAELQFLPEYGLSHRIKVGGREAHLDTGNNLSKNHAFQVFTRFQNEEEGSIYAMPISKDVAMLEDEKSSTSSALAALQAYIEPLSNLFDLLRSVPLSKTNCSSWIVITTSTPTFLQNAIVSNREYFQQTAGISLGTYGSAIFIRTSILMTASRLLNLLYSFGIQNISMFLVPL